MEDIDDGFRKKDEWQYFLMPAPVSNGPTPPRGVTEADIVACDGLFRFGDIISWVLEWWQWRRLLHHHQIEVCAARLRWPLRCGPIRAAGGRTNKVDRVDLGNVIGMQGLRKAFGAGIPTLRLEGVYDN